MKLNLTRRLCLLLWLGIVIGWPVERAVAKPPNVLLIYIVSTMDERIGQVLDFLDQQGLTDNTIVVLQSDHGHSTEERTFGGGGSAGPYRGAKFSLFEGRIRVPAMISWPQHIPQGAIRGQLATAVDWLPTLCALSDVPLPPNPIGGKDLRAVLQSGEVPTPHEVFHWESGRGKNGKPQWAVRRGQWKLIGNPNDTSNQAPITAADDRFLVNLDEDPGELTNLAPQHPEIVDQLEKLHQQWNRNTVP